MNGPTPPVKQPEPRACEPAPPVKEGLVYDTKDNWFLKFTNMRQLANGDHQERVNGVRISLALSFMTAVTWGWAHNTIIGGSLTHIKGKDLKLGLVAAIGFIASNKTEITKANKDEKIYGLKVSHVTGKKNKFQGSNRLESSKVEKAEFMSKCAEYWALRKEVAKQMKDTIAMLDRENTGVEESFDKCSREFDKAKVESSDASTRATSLTANIGTLLQDASTTKTHATGNFKVIADSAADFLASAKWDGDFGSEVKLLSSSLQEFAAPISKLG